MFILVDMMYTHFLRSTPGAPLPVSLLTQPVSQSVWLGLSLSLCPSLSFCLSVWGGGCLSPAPWPGVHWECLSHGCVRSVHLQALSLLLPLSVQCILLACLAVVLCGVLAYVLCVSDAAGITWLLVCALYVFREECRWVRGHLCLIFTWKQG